MTSKEQQQQEQQQAYMGEEGVMMMTPQVEVMDNMEMTEMGHVMQNRPSYTSTVSTGGSGMPNVGEAVDLRAMVRKFPRLVNCKVKLVPTIDI